MWSTLIAFGFVPWANAQGGLVINPKNADVNAVGSGSGGASSIAIDLSSDMNNRAFAMTPGDADYDGVHSGYPAQFLPEANLTYSGVNYKFPQYQKYGNDNVLAQGQTITPPKGRYFSVHMLVAAERAVATGFINATYADGTTSSGSILVDPFWDFPYPFGGDIIFPYHLTNSSINYNRSMIFQSINRLDSTKDLVSLTLPNVTAVTANGTGVDLDIQLARTTQIWMEGTDKTQIVEVRVDNVGQEWVLAEHSVKVTVSSPGLKTVVPGIINRLRPGDQAIVQVGVVNTDGTEPGTTGPATVEINGNGVQASLTFNATYGIGRYEATYESIYAHESPPWFTNGKFGIFIHWGVYSVPGWGNVGKKEMYAEWYWWYLNQGRNSKAGDWYDYHLATYGPDVVYDDFIQNFTASAFDPKEWVDLFADSGAQYFVQVSKHHDGFAIFDTGNVSARNSVAQFPHKNLLQEIFDAATLHQPHLHKATYFSLPEWFHPDYKPIGFSIWPGGNATNPFTNQTLPYTGYIPVQDYVHDLILPEMNILANMGTEIMWCDIGGPNLTAEFAASYFNDAASRGQQVLLNNRCGLPGDFDTPEYARYNAVQVRKWESNLGMDPFSYGYNRATPDEAYLTPQGIVTSLVDIVSKNGNFLLDVGPTANGTIVQIEQDNLRAAGMWIKGHAEAIFNTTYWFVTPQEGEAVRFTQTPDAFYILALYPPNGTLVLDSPVPWVEGDQVEVVGGKASGTVVPTKLLGNGSLEVTVSEAVREADEFCWVFKILFC
ncbi:alpha-l-fucosidase like protein [Zymoseptoria brevis]|uniref:alpha-L-fucosidase n=1 Tax=Zymoseptoria brevis TaxID=1047168 RepID=A0A0F4GTA1_9PEZI|nr:alpha-l-fucosidase like protein [Zymoseptoria brevis]